MAFNGHWWRRLDWTFVLFFTFSIICFELHRKVITLDEGYTHRHQTLCWPRWDHAASTFLLQRSDDHHGMAREQARAGERIGGDKITLLIPQEKHFRRSDSVVSARIVTGCWCTARSHGRLERGARWCLLSGRFSAFVFLERPYHQFYCTYAKAPTTWSWPAASLRRMTSRNDTDEREQCS